MRSQSVGGLIINLGSSSASGGRIDQGAYAASKAGVLCLTETVALEGKEHGVVAYCVVPRRTFTQLRLDMFPEEVRSQREARV
jgi:NAD(P)-dependent dehydrogenase (short-subunit alcohol dehydrogenase family)